MAGFGLLPAGRVTAQTFTNVYSFTATGGAYTNRDGAYPSAGLILSNNTLYGTTQLGGTNGNGTVFAVNTDGTGFTVLHTFTALINSTNSDGTHPQAGLLQDGPYLYGTAESGGTNGNGTVFRLRTDGLYFTNLHNFTALSTSFGGTNSDGANPAAGLTLAGFTTLYGTAQSGGTNGNGTVFAVNEDGTGFTVLHTFTANKSGTNSDGATPLGGLIASANDTLYGTANGGGTHGNGTVFALNPDGTGFTNLYSFTAFSSVYFNNYDGENPYGGLVLSGGTLYGTTHSGGTNNAGTVFAVATNGTGFTVLHGFTGGSDGANPYAGLVLSGSTLFGTAGNDGNSYDGTVFAVNTNGTGFTTPHTFTNSPDGYSPHAGLISSGNTLYGTANGGTNGTGMVFSLSLPKPQLKITFSGRSVVMVWPTNLLNFTLQSTTNLDPVWSPVLLSPVIINGQNVVTNPISGAPQQFFRLSL
ncbi:MAG: choice-of-anchor tandem repeat GloVer-containing protein [Verrucomicrobiota bacterium]